jgi:hypothetical protein
VRNTLAYLAHSKVMKETKCCEYRPRCVHFPVIVSSSKGELGSKKVHLKINSFLVAALITSMTLMKAALVTQLSMPNACISNAANKTICF